MPLGQWYKLLVARKWFKLIFSKLAKPFNLVLWHKTRTCGNKKNLRLLKLGKGVQRSLKRFSLKEFCWLGFITPMWEEKKALIYLYTSSFPLSSFKYGSSPLPSHFQPLGWKPTFSRSLFPNHISIVNSVHTFATDIVENTTEIEKCLPAVTFLLKQHCSLNFKIK